MQQDNNYLLQQSVSDFSYQLRLKLKYLQQQKDKLQLASNQMIQNINLLRIINKQLSKSLNPNNNPNKSLKQYKKQQSQQQSSPANILFHHLQSQNQLLQQSYLRIFQSHNSLQCQNLMLNQIIQQSSQQYRNVLKQYQSKIIQLRRSIQFKQSCIQTYQMNKQIINNVNNNCVEMGNIAPSNVSILFFNQIDTYKQTIQQLEKRNKLLEKQVKSKEDKLKKVQKDKQSIQMLILSSNGYYQFKHLLKEQIINGKSRIKSQPKYDIIKSLLQVNKNITNQQQPIQPKTNKSSSNKKNNLTSTQSTQLTTFTSSTHNNNSPKLIQLKQQLKKKTIQYNKLGNLYHKQKTKRKQLQQKIKIIINSNKFYKQKRQENHNQLKYYKKTTEDLIKIIQKRKVKEKKSYSSQKQKNMFEEIVKNVKNKNIQLTPEQQNKKILFKQFKKDLDALMKKKKVIVGLDNKQKCKLKRSYSDILGYIQLSHQDDKVEKYYYRQQKSPKNSPKKSQNSHNNIKNRQVQILSKQTENQNDFSHLLSLGRNGQIFNDQSLLIKPSKVMSYAQRRKMKSNSNYNNFDAHNLTIIRENVL